MDRKDSLQMVSDAGWKTRGTMHERGKLKQKCSLPLALDSIYMRTGHAPGFSIGLIVLKFPEIQRTRVPL
jgi:hypothetical protein